MLVIYCPHYDSGTTLHASVVKLYNTQYILVNGSFKIEVLHQEIIEAEKVLIRMFADIDSILIPFGFSRRSYCES